MFSPQQENLVPKLIIAQKNERKLQMRVSLLMVLNILQFVFIACSAFVLSVR